MGEWLIKVVVEGEWLINVAIGIASSSLLVTAVIILIKLIG